MLAIDLLPTTDAHSRTVIAIAIGAAAAVSTMTLWLSFGRIVPAKIPESEQGYR
jgi:hypothetical protein